MDIVLASQSPRRRELIQLLHLPFQARVADVDEDSIQTPNLTENVLARALLKGSALASLLPQHLILAADTAVALEGKMLNKPANAIEAWSMLSALRGRIHQVHTGVGLFLPNREPIQILNTAVVTMRSYTNQEIEAYIATGDPLDKAGAYAIQHPLFDPVASLNGCYLGVMGLPVCHLCRVLRAEGVPVKVNISELEAAHGNFSSCPDLKLLQN